MRRHFPRAALIALAVTAGLIATLAISGAAPSTVSGASAPRIISWSGFRWLVYPSNHEGPEPGVKMTDSPQSVYVDSLGRLHLKIRKINGVWRSVELRALTPTGTLTPTTYGTYRWVVRGATAKFSRNTVLGMFIYQSTGHKLSNEIDIEDSRFTKWIQPNNASYTVQPYYDPHHWCTFKTSKRLKLSSQEFTWAPERVTFVTRHGTSALGKPAALICRRPGAGNPTATTTREFTYTGSGVPKPNSQHLYINLWTNMNRPPTHGTRSIVLDSFTFTPLPN